MCYAVDANITFGAIFDFKILNVRLYIEIITYLSQKQQLFATKQGLCCTAADIYIP